MTLSDVVQVERRVVNLLAAAYEQGLIVKGSQVELVVEAQGEERGPAIRLNVAGKRTPVSVDNVSTQLHVAQFQI